MLFKPCCCFVRYCLLEPESLAGFGRRVVSGMTADTGRSIATGSLSKAILTKTDLRPHCSPQYFFIINSTLRLRLKTNSVTQLFPPNTPLINRFIFQSNRNGQVFLGFFNLREIVELITHSLLFKANAVLLSRVCNYILEPLLYFERSWVPQKGATSRELNKQR